MVEVEDRKVVVENVAVTNVRPFVVVGIPAFNEEKTIARIVLEAQRYADRVVVCDDGSTDMTAEIARRLGADVVSNQENGGKGKALKTLFAEILKLKPDIVVTLDADGQHNAKEIPELLRPIVCDESDVVVGNRYVRGSKAFIPLYRRGGLALINWINRSVGKMDVKDTQNGFRAYSFKAFKAISLHESNDYNVESEQLILASKASLRIKEVPVSVKYAGLKNRSKKSLLAHGMGLIGFILKLVVEERPLLLLGIPGILSSFIGALFGIWMLQIYAAEHRIVTNVALASVAFVLIGLFALFTAITLYGMVRLTEKTSIKEQKKES
jgi:glycosyltransferase involved in cell wall biosynthesis